MGEIILYDVKAYYVATVIKTVSGIGESIDK